MVYAGGGVDITLIGEKELQRKFKGLPGKLQRKIVRAAMKKPLNRSCRMHRAKPRC